VTTIFGATHADRLIREVRWPSSGQVDVPEDLTEAASEKSREGPRAAAPEDMS